MRRVVISALALYLGAIEWVADKVRKLKEWLEK